MKYTKEQYAKTLYEVFLDAKPSDIKSHVKHFVSLLRRNGDIKEVRKIVERFSDYMDEKEGRQKVIVTSARELSESEKKVIKKTLEESTQKKVDLEEMIDPTLLGGVKVKMGDEVFDFTLRRKLRSFLGK